MDADETPLAYLRASASICGSKFLHCKCGVSADSFRHVDARIKSAHDGENVGAGVVAAIRQ